MSWFYYLVLLTFIKIFLFSKSYKGKISSINELWVFLFCIFYCLFAPSDVLYGFNAVIKIFAYFFAFIVGKRVVEEEGTNEKVIIHYTIVLALGSASLGAISLINNIKNYGLFGFERIMPEFWTGNMLNATSQSALFLLLSGVSFYVLVLVKKQYLLKMTVIAGICFLILNAFLISSRTAIIYPVVAFLISYLSNLVITKKINLGNYILLNLILFIVFILYVSNVWDIQNLVSQLPLFRRLNNEVYLTLAEDDRLGVYSFFLQNMADYPFGGLNSINPIYYMHNLWLDVYATSGIIPFIFLFLFTVRIFVNIYKIVKHPNVNSEFKIFLIGVYSAFFLLFMTEPVLLSSPWFFLTFCLITGMTDKYHDSLDSITRSSLKESFKTNQNLEAIT